MTDVEYEWMALEIDTENAMCMQVGKYTGMRMMMMMYLSWVSMLKQMELEPIRFV